MSAPTRLQELIDAPVLWTFLGGVEKHSTSDLVVFLDQTEPESLPRVSLRTEWLEKVAGPVSEEVRKKLLQPASEAARRRGKPLEGTQMAFWFVARFADGTMDSVFIISQRMPEAGDA